ncbi:unnamed protein product [Phytomonas sp. EM1]|nr:unnamed protein product [Phytomonas sp. EM1]|eukprot:CCW64210.1 unnamed protein product [Phytomonas sp. isolate EM1]
MPNEMIAVPDIENTLIHEQLNNDASSSCVNRGVVEEYVSGCGILAYEKLVHKLWFRNEGRSRLKRKREPALRVIKPHNASILPPMKREKVEGSNYKATPISFLPKDLIKTETELSADHPNGSATSEESKKSDSIVHKYFNYYLPEQPPVYNSKEIYFRMATSDDRKQWSSLVVASCRGNIAGIEMQLTTLEAPCRIVAVRACDKALVGLVAMQTKGWISFIACDVDYRHNGLGSFLLFLALEWLRVRQGTSASLTPIDRSVMNFYYKWGFQAYPAEGSRTRRLKKKLDPSNIVMERKIDADVCLLPNGRPLKYYLQNYDSSGEVPNTSPWAYYYYFPKLQKTTQCSLDSKSKRNGKQKTLSSK